MSDKRAHHARVLAEAKRLFDDLLANDQYPLVIDAQKVISEALELSPPQTAMILRSLHREGQIGLLNGPGIMCSIGPDQSSMGSVNRFVTHDPRRAGGKPLVKPGRLSGHTYEEPPEEGFDVVTLLGTIEELEGLVTGLTQENAGLSGKLSTARNRALKAKADRRQAIEAKNAAEGEARRLRSELTRLREEAARVPGLLEQLAALQSTDVVDQEMADKIDRLTVR